MPRSSGGPWKPTSPTTSPSGVTAARAIQSSAAGSAATCGRRMFHSHAWSARYGVAVMPDAADAAARSPATSASIVATDSGTRRSAGVSTRRC